MRNSLRRLPPAALAVAFATVRPAGAQVPPRQTPDLLVPVSTEVVRIDVVVTDKGGISRAGADGEEALPARAIPPRRYVVLAVDDVHIEAGNLLRIKKSLDRFLEREIGPEDRIALVTTSGTRGLYQEFTDDRQALRESVARLSVQDRSSLFLLKKEDGPGETAEAPAGGALSLRGTQARRRFKRGETLYVQHFAYNAGRDASGATNLVTQAEIWRGGVLLASSAPESMPQSDRGGPPLLHTRSVKLEPFGPGDCEVRIVVTDGNAREMTSRRVGFTIE